MEIKTNRILSHYTHQDPNIFIIAPGERSKPGAYQTFTDSKWGRGGGGCLPKRLRCNGRLLEVPLPKAGQSEAGI